MFKLWLKFNLKVHSSWMSCVVDFVSISHCAQFSIFGFPRRQTTSVVWSIIATVFCLMEFTTAYPIPSLAFVPVFHQDYIRVAGTKFTNCQVQGPSICRVNKAFIFFFSNGNVYQQRLTLEWAPGQYRTLTI
jgi:hypothetical protein